MDVVLALDTWCDNFSRHGWAGTITPRLDQLAERPCVYLPDDPHEPHDTLAAHLKITVQISARRAQWLEDAGTPQEDPVGRRRLSQRVG